MKNNYTFFILISYSLLFQTCTSPAKVLKPLENNRADLIPRTTFFQPTERFSVQLSPNGKFISYMTMTDGQRHITILSTNNLKAVKTLVIEIPIRTYQWTYTNQLLITSRTNEGYQLWTVNPKDSNAKIVKSPKAVSISIMDKSLTMKQKIAVAIEAEQSDLSGLYILDLNGGDYKKTEDLANYINWKVDGNYKLRAAERRNDLGGNTLFRKNNVGEWIEIADYPWDMSYLRAKVNRIISVKNDGSEFYYTDNSKTDKAILKSINTETGKEKILVEDKDADVLFAGHTLNEDGTIAAAVALFGKTKRHFLDKSLKEHYDFIKSQYNGDISFGGKSLDGSVWLMKVLNGNPQRHFLYYPKEKKLIFLFSDIPNLDELYHKMAVRYPYLVKTKDGQTLPCQIYMSPEADKNKDGLPDKPMPTILYVHGGPWVGFLNNSWFSNRNFQLLANRGYLVINTEFRGAVGYGKHFVEISKKEWGKAMHQDLIEIAETAVNDGLAKKDKIGIWGWSYGGYASAFAMGKSPETFACGVSMYGVLDLKKFMELPFASNNLWHTYTVNPTTDSDILKTHSPLTYAKDVANPMLMTHGTLDDRTPQSQSDTYVAALEKHKKEITYFIYPDEPHDYRADKSWIQFWAITERFLHQHLGGNYEPYNDDLLNPNFTMKTGANYVNGLQKEVNRKENNH